jgi:hypothetical protein
LRVAGFAKCSSGVVPNCSGNSGRNIFVAVVAANSVEDVGLKVAECAAVFMTPPAGGRSGGFETDYFPKNCRVPRTLCEKNLHNERRA